MVENMSKTTKIKRKRSEKKEEEKQSTPSDSTKGKKKEIAVTSSQIQAEMDDMDALFGEVVCFVCLMMHEMKSNCFHTSYFTPFRMILTYFIYGIYGIEKSEGGGRK